MPAPWTLSTTPADPCKHCDKMPSVLNSSCTSHGFQWHHSFLYLSGDGRISILAFWGVNTKDFTFGDSGADLSGASPIPKAMLPKLCSGGGSLEIQHWHSLVALPPCSDTMKTGLQVMSSVVSAWSPGRANHQRSPKSASICQILWTGLAGGAASKD